MGDSTLSALQVRVLRALAGLEPPWTLTGGGALAGLYLGHRKTRDLDLFWHGLHVLPELSELLGALESEGVQVDVLRRTPAFVELRARSGDEVTVIDLVADPVPTVEVPTRVEVDGISVQVDTLHEILVNKLNALLSRSELRDLVDLRALLAAGADLPRGLVDAEQKDGGFSAATLAWVLKSLPIAALGRANRVSETEVAELEGFRESLVTTVAQMCRPGS